MTTVTRRRKYLTYRKLDGDTAGRQRSLSAYFTVLEAQEDVAAMLDLDAMMAAAASEMRDRCLACIAGDSAQHAAVLAISPQLVARTVCTGRV